MVMDDQTLHRSPAAAEELLQAGPGRGLRHGVRTTDGVASGHSRGLEAGRAAAGAGYRHRGSAPPGFCREWVPRPPWIRWTTTRPC